MERSHQNSYIYFIKQNSHNSGVLWHSNNVEFSTNAFIKTLFILLRLDNYNWITCGHRKSSKIAYPQTANTIRDNQLQFNLSSARLWSNSPSGVVQQSTTIDREPVAFVSFPGVGACWLLLAYVHSTENNAANWLRFVLLVRKTVLS